MLRPRCVNAVPMLAVLAGACSQGTPLPKLPELPRLPELGAPNEPGRVAGAVSDVYTRIARGAMACWFGADGALKGSHIFHAEVDPPSRGGAAEVAVHRIEPDQPTPWGRRVFRVRLDPVDEATAIAIESTAMPGDVAGRMRADVFQWAAGKPACSTRESPELAKVRAGSISRIGTPLAAWTAEAAECRA